MAKSRNWEALSPAYRSRLERGGISRSAYEAGASVSAARGHAATPERPERAARNPERYAGYVERKATPKTASESAKLRRKVEKIGKRYDIPEILEVIRPGDRANFVSGWELAHSEYLSNRAVKGAVNTFGRARLDVLEQAHPEAPKEIGYYH